MQPFTFIHAADLHLDAVLPAAPGENGPETDALLSRAVFIALERLVRLAIEEKASFLVLAGDVFHNGSGSLKAAFALSDACKKLADHDIEVFWARGNHDSISQSDEAMRWPANLHIYTPEGERLCAGGAPAGLLGISHKSRHERGNLTERLAKAAGLPLMEESFEIGVFHCAVNGEQGAHAAYAPCNLGDLTGSGKGYWALGHVHTPAVLSKDPLVVYSGSLQGLHVNEDGAHGCFVVPVDGSGKAAPRFEPLAPVRWQRVRLEMNEDIASLDALEEAAMESVRALADDIFSTSARPWQKPELLQVRLELAGRTALDGLLRKSGSISELLLRLNATASALDGVLPVKVRLKDIALATSPDVNTAALMQSDDLVGETLRRSMAVAETLESLAKEGISDFAALEEALVKLPWGPDFIAALSPLYGDRRMRESGGIPTVGELAEMAREAASLCLYQFEVEG